MSSIQQRKWTCWEILFEKLAHFDFRNWYLGTISGPIPSPKLCTNKTKNFSRKNSTVIFMTLKCQRFFPFILFISFGKLLNVCDWMKEKSIQIYFYKNKTFSRFIRISLIFPAKRINLMTLLLSLRITLNVIMMSVVMSSVRNNNCDSVTTLSRIIILSEHH